VTRFGSGENEELPAPRAGGCYKINFHQQGRFVEASPSRFFRDGEGTLLLN